jgi:hypothetical protein
MSAVLSWFLFFLCVLLAFSRLIEALPALLRKSSGGEVLAAEGVFLELEETLSSGLLPGEERWARLDALAEPWRSLSVESLRSLRSEGGSVVPTLRRFRELARAHFDSLGEAKARSSQAIAQAAVCGLLVPLFGFVLHSILPDVEDAGAIWWLGTGLATGLGLLSGAWIWKMAENARWGGLRGNDREWMLASLVFAERLLALLRLGRAPDQAWISAVAELPPALHAEWGGDAWTTPVEGEAPSKTLRDSLARAGNSFRKAIQSSLWDGHPCSERIESAASGLRSEIRACQERELQLLGTRALKPLFLLTAPALLGLLGFALALSVGSALS